VDLRSLPLRAVFSGAEPMTDGMRKEIEAQMGVTLYEQYGLSEIIGPGVAWACGRSDGMHVCEDHFVPEIVDPDTGDPLPDGELGELVLSAPSKEAFPVLRYRTRDLVRISHDPCPCGRTFARISKVLGRTDDMMIIRGVNVFPSQIEHALLGVDGLEPHYQIVLFTRPDRQTGLRVRVEASSSPDPALEDRAGEALRNALDLSVAVELVSPHTIPRSEGKAVRVVDEREETP
jgi:phenylacetate-CoA ligase